MSTAPDGIWLRNSRPMCKVCAKSRWPFLGPGLEAGFRRARPRQVQKCGVSATVVWRFRHSSMARTCPSSAPSSLRASSLVRRQRRRQVGFVFVVGDEEKCRDGPGFVRPTGLGDEFVEPAEKLVLKPACFSGFHASSHSPNGVLEPGKSATLKLHFRWTGFRPKSSICNLISEIALLTLPRPPGGSNGTWVTLYYQDMGYSRRHRTAGSLPRVDA
jgi:hypothetical protein